MGRISDLGIPTRCATAFMRGKPNVASNMGLLMKLGSLFRELPKG